MTMKREPRQQFAEAQTTHAPKEAAPLPPASLAAPAKASPNDPKPAAASRHGRYRKGGLREGVIQEEIERILGRVPWVAIMHNNTGYAIGPSGKPFHYGTKGAADILVFVAPLGRLVALECKARWGMEAARKNPDQYAWAEDKRRVGAVAEFVRGEGDDSKAAVERACTIVWRAHEETMRLAHKDSTAGADAELERTLKQHRQELDDARAEVARLIERQEQREKRPFTIRGGAAKRQHSI